MATRKDTKTAFAVLEDNRERAREALQRIVIEENYQPLVAPLVSNDFSASIENINYGATLVVPRTQIEWISIFPPLLRNEFLNLLVSKKEPKTELKKDKPEKVIDRFKRMVVVANHKNKKKKI